jgi:hypothetical protein
MEHGFHSGLYEFLKFFIKKYNYKSLPSVELIWKGESIRKFLEIISDTNAKISEEIYCL